ncbi:MAG: hypothetical protein PHX44_08140 [Sulfurimonas sp.]|nr:hypothetical protein [Sulfurimonas sp.]MDD2653003.1 hypothetical protein [Sulfurimonas sp.]MDD3452449.1 hypothetical protein [Sulfurimonas sp.]
MELLGLGGQMFDGKIPFEIFKEQKAARFLNNRSYMDGIIR